MFGSLRKNTGTMVLALVLAWTYLKSIVHAGEGQDGEDLFAAQLLAGEFTQALQWAGRIDDEPRRDANLARIALAQAESGAQRAALFTLGQVIGDQARARAFSDLRALESGKDGATGIGAEGGGVEADFDSLIELITSTIAPDSWDEVGGPGAIDEFAGGVFVDPEGVLRVAIQPEGAGGRLSVRREAAGERRGVQLDRRSPLRKVSLSRLQRRLQLLKANGRGPDESMAMLAGLERVEYLFIYPESGDLVIAGPAGPWQSAGEGRMVSQSTGRPVVHLDDLVVLLRHYLFGTQSRFGCSITPTRHALARTNSFLAQSRQRSLRVGERDTWLASLRAQLGRQQIDIFGIEPGTRVARVLVEADYRMKLIGLGLEEGVLGVTNYLDLVQVAAGQAPPPLDVLRWWFTLNYQAVVTTEARDAFQIRGQGVQVLSENELLTAQGHRVHTGKSEPLNRQFAQSFTEHFPTLCAKYPIYAELQNIFDLALIAALIAAEDLPAQVGSQLATFVERESYVVPEGPIPRTVETVMNHRVIRRRYILAGVSGGVSVDPSPYTVTNSMQLDTSGRLYAKRTGTPQNLPDEAWWWD